MLELTDFDDTGTFISYASNGITLNDEGTCK